MKRFIFSLTILFISTLYAFAAGETPETLPAVDSAGTQSAQTEPAPVEPENAADAAAPDDGPVSVYVFPIREDIMPATARLTDKCLKEADEKGADIVIIDMKTYGGLVDAADSIRTRILNYDKPVYVFINNQAASAGALISIAADRIYMRDGASIGAATVVDQSGAEVPDKYQSFMRGMMRSTAEAHGKVIDRISGRDTLWRWYRDPAIAEAMVDPSVVVDGLIGEGKVLTLSAQEAEKWHYCEGRASSIDEVIRQAGIDRYEITEYRPTTLDRILGFLTNPAFQGVMIMLIIGGIYFEMQTPGIGFALAVAILGGVLYFAPLYLEGLLNHWEIALFVVGVLLIILEIFVTPGFGVLGITGIACVIFGMAFAMIDTDLLRYIPSGELSLGFVLRPVLLVIISVTAALVVSIPLGKRLLTGQSKLRRRVVLDSAMTVEEGFTSHATDRDFVGREVVTTTDLRPSGKVMIDGKLYEAAGENGLFIPRDTTVTVIRDEGGVLYCRTLRQ